MFRVLRSNVGARRASPPRPRPVLRLESLEDRWQPSLLGPVGLTTAPLGALGVALPVPVLSSTPTAPTVQAGVPTATANPSPSPAAASAAVVAPPTPFTAPVAQDGPASAGVSAVVEAAAPTITATPAATGSQTGANALLTSVPAMGESGAASSVVLSAVTVAQPAAQGDSTSGGTAVHLDPGGASGDPVIGDDDSSATGADDGVKSDDARPAAAPARPDRPADPQGEQPEAPARPTMPAAARPHTAALDAVFIRASAHADAGRLDGSPAISWRAFGRSLSYGAAFVGLTLTGHEPVRAYRTSRRRRRRGGAT